MTILMSRLAMAAWVKARRAHQTEIHAAKANQLGAAPTPTETRTEHNLQGPWCCAEGQRLRLFVPCAECADTSAAYSAAMAPARGDEA